MPAPAVTEGRPGGWAGTVTRPYAPVPAAFPKRAMPKAFHHGSHGSHGWGKDAIGVSASRAFLSVSSVPSVVKPFYPARPGAPPHRPDSGFSIFLLTFLGAGVYCPQKAQSGDRRGTLTCTCGPTHRSSPRPSSQRSRALTGPRPPVTDSTGSCCERTPPCAGVLPGHPSVAAEGGQAGPPLRTPSRRGLPRITLSPCAPHHNIGADKGT